MDQDQNDQLNNQPANAPQPAQAPQQNAPVAPPQQYAQTSGENPGQLFGILSLVSTFLGLSLVGAILGYFSAKKSNEAGQSATLGKVGMWIGIVITVLSVLATILIIVLMVIGAAASESSSGSSSSSFESSYN